MDMETDAGPDGRAAETEWRVRCDLAALYRLVAYHRWTDFIYTHISARLPGPGHQFLINRYGVNFHEMRASDLVRIGVDGQVLEHGGKTSRDVNAAGFTIHSAIHMARPDLTCVSHTHSSAGIAVSAMQEGLLPISQHAMKFYNRIGYHDYEGIALDIGERSRLVADLGPHKAMILRNHGLLAAGTSIPEAFHQLYMLERACAAQVAALSCGRELTVPRAEVCQHASDQFHSFEGDTAHYTLLWDAALRLIEGQGSDYRT
jgi:ribulose-5-phosphate 4-epimerase/fuculose-1-phosphate aldolase